MIDQVIEKEAETVPAPVRRLTPQELEKISQPFSKNQEPNCRRTGRIDLRNADEKRKRWNDIEEVMKSDSLFLGRPAKPKPVFSLAGVWGCPVGMDTTANPPTGLPVKSSRGNTQTRKTAGSVYRRRPEYDSTCPLRARPARKIKVSCARKRWSKPVLRTVPGWALEDP